MKRTLSVLVIAAMIISGAAAAGAEEILYGNRAAKADADLGIGDMLLYAAQDEYLARGEYLAIMEKFGAARPFTNIERAEENHLAQLRGAFSSYGISFPSDASKSHVSVPSSLKEAFAAGVQAELDNIAMYDRFLASPLLSDPRYAELKALFTNLTQGAVHQLEERVGESSRVLQEAGGEVLSPVRGQGFWRSRRSRAGCCEGGGSEYLRKVIRNSVNR
jgi:hypothetical protein